MRRTLGLLLAASAASMAATGRKRTAPSMLMDPMLQPTEPVLYSARQMAGARALESRRKDALFRDELSQHFAGDDVMQKIEERVRRAEAKGPSRFGRKIAVRTRYFDDAIEEFCENRRLEDVQVLLLGAGMDSRSWRLPKLRNAEVIEVDHEKVLRAKALVLNEVAPRLTARSRAPVGMDLSRWDWTQRLLELRVPNPNPNPKPHPYGAVLVPPPPPRFGALRLGLTAWCLGAARLLAPQLSGKLPRFGLLAWLRRVAARVLLRFGAAVAPRVEMAEGRTLLQRDQPLCVLMEGLLMYLSPREVKALLRHVGGLGRAGASRVCASLVDWQSVRDAQRSSRSALLRSWKWGCDREDIAAFFERHLGPGWKVLRVDRVGPDVHYGGAIPNLNLSLT